MADRKISQLPHLEEIIGNEEFVVEKDGYNYNVTTDDIRAGLASADEVGKIKDAQEQDLTKITELAGKLNGIDNVQEALNKKADATTVTNLQSDLEAEKTRATTAEQAIADDIDNIEALIPAQTTADNQLADRDFVNSSIATNTADFKGTFTSLAELQKVTADANDYGFVVSTDVDGNTVYNRYKYTEGEGWKFEYALNNSSFTAAQWAALNSSITSALVEKLSAMPNASDILTGKQAATKYYPLSASQDLELLVEILKERLGDVEEDMLSKSDAESKYQPKGDYLTADDLPSGGSIVGAPTNTYTFLCIKPGIITGCIKTVYAQDENGEIYLSVIGEVPITELYAILTEPRIYNLKVWVNPSTFGNEFQFTSVIDVVEFYTGSGGAATTAGSDIIPLKPVTPSVTYIANFYFNDTLGNRHSFRIDTTMTEYGMSVSNVQ